MKKVAVTGNLASGKTQALKFLKKLGAYTLNSDKIANDLLLNKESIKKKVINFFGQNILTKGKIDKKKLAKIVFNDKKKLKFLEDLLHPEILNIIEKSYCKVKDKNFSMFAVELPLLYEIGWQSHFDYVILILTKEEIAKKRYKGKDYRNRVKRMFPVKRKAKLADFVIDNNQPLLSLEKKIKKISQIINAKEHPS